MAFTETTRPSSSSLPIGGSTALLPDMGRPVTCVVVWDAESIFPILTPGKSMQSTRAITTFKNQLQQFVYHLHYPEPELTQSVTPQTANNPLPKLVVVLSQETQAASLGATLASRLSYNWSTVIKPARKEDVVEALLEQLRSLSDLDVYLVTGRPSRDVLALVQAWKDRLGHPPRRRSGSPAGAPPLVVLHLNPAKQAKRPENAGPACLLRNLLQGGYLELRPFAEHILKVEIPSWSSPAEIPQSPRAFPTPKCRIILSLPRRASAEEPSIPHPAQEAEAEALQGGEPKPIPTAVADQEPEPEPEESPEDQSTDAPMVPKRTPVSLGLVAKGNPRTPKRSVKKTPPPPQLPPFAAVIRLPKFAALLGKEAKARAACEAQKETEWAAVHQRFEKGLEFVAGLIRRRLKAPAQLDIVSLLKQHRGIELTHLADYWYQLALLERRPERLDQRRGWLQQAVFIDPKHASARLLLEHVCNAQLDWLADTIGRLPWKNVEDASHRTDEKRPLPIKEDIEPAAGIPPQSSVEEESHRTEEKHHSRPAPPEESSERARGVAGPRRATFATLKLAAFTLVCLLMMVLFHRFLRRPNSFPRYLLAAKNV